jgi:cyclopropane fatty-acyl-phospholipid synthase-like methyltransferase
MIAFSEYAAYYDLLYKDKDYNAESEFIECIIKKYNSVTTSILDMGCGTGNHDFYLSKRGYNVTGFDCSEANINIAQSKLAASDLSKENLEFKSGDIRNFREKKKFDAILSLFHVMSYMSTNSDLRFAFETAKAHMGKKSLFIFDCWYGPAVLTNPPKVCIKNVENQNVRIIRISNPEVFPNENIIDVKYHLIVKNKLSLEYSEIKETHRMRYLFQPEIIEIAKSCGLKLLECFKWMTNEPPDLDAWGVYFIFSLDK